MSTKKQKLDRPPVHAGTAIYNCTFTVNAQRSPEEVKVLSDVVDGLKKAIDALHHVAVHLGNGPRTAPMVNIEAPRTPS